MKPNDHIPAGKRAASVVTPQVQTESRLEPSATSEEAMVEAIQVRADYVGPVLEEILRADHYRAGGPPPI